MAVQCGDWSVVPRVNPTLLSQVRAAAVTLFACPWCVCGETRTRLDSIRRAAGRRELEVLIVLALRYGAAARSLPAWRRLGTTFPHTQTTSTNPTHRDIFTESRPSAQRTYDITLTSLELQLPHRRRHSHTSCPATRLPPQSMSLIHIFKRGPVYQQLRQQSTKASAAHRTSSPSRHTAVRPKPPASPLYKVAAFGRMSAPEYSTAGDGQGLKLVNRLNESRSPYVSAPWLSPAAQAAPQC